MNAKLPFLSQFRSTAFVGGLAICAAIGPLAHGAEPGKRPLVVGHRGLVHAAPENTLAAFRACLALRVGFEFDVRQSGDGQLACIHDATLERTTDGRGRVTERKLAELRTLDAGSWFDPAFRGERIPRVEEIFDLVAEHGSEEALIAVDLKLVGGGIEEELVRLAEQRKILERLVFIGLAIESADVRQRLKAASPKAPVARLAASTDMLDEVLRDKGADWVYLRFLPAADEIARIHAVGKRVFLAGPLVAGHEPENWSRASELGIDAILSDYPLELRRKQPASFGGQRP
jgi:glycerophosphoryl diester phosphodiesterase